MLNEIAKLGTKRYERERLGLSCFLESLKRSITYANYVNFVIVRKNYTCLINVILIVLERKLQFWT